MQDEGQPFLSRPFGELVSRSAFGQSPRFHIYNGTIEDLTDDVNKLCTKVSSVSPVSA